MAGCDEIDVLLNSEENPCGIQTEVVEWEEVSPECYELKPQTWDLGAVYPPVNTAWNCAKSAKSTSRSRLKSMISQDGRRSTAGPIMHSANA